jgi:histidinol-phosphate aminotransferase
VTAVGLRDYYRQFEAETPEETSRRLREEAQERRRRALARVEPVDLSSTTWPHLPPPAVVNAVTFAARRGLHRPPDPKAGELRAELAHRVGVPPSRVVVGSGASQLLAAAAEALLSPGDELVTPWPSHPLLPLLARRAGATAVPAPGFGVRAVLEALGERTRVVALCNPNDPTGAWLDEAALTELLGALPERVVVLLDEALVEYAPRSATRLVERFPRLLAVRTFSKAWGLAGLRIGYAVGGPESEPLLERIAPPGGVGELAQVGALAALRETEPVVERRVASVRDERDRLAAELRDLGLEVAPSEANLLWIAAPGLDGAGLADRLARAKVLVASGGTFGDDGHVRAAVHERERAERLRDALAAVAPG